MKIGNLKQRLLRSGETNTLLTSQLRAAKTKEDNDYFPVEAPERGFSQTEIIIATVSRMTGPRASRPTFRAVRKTILRMRKGSDITEGRWRQWPTENINYQQECKI